MQNIDKKSSKMICLLLGWKPTRCSIEEEVLEILKAEHARLQKK
jgi:hypothetical protein